MHNVKVWGCRGRGELEFGLKAFILQFSQSALKKKPFYDHTTINVEKSKKQKWMKKKGRLFVD